MPGRIVSSPWLALLALLLSAGIVPGGRLAAANGPVSLRLEVSADRPRYAVGEAVRLTLAVTNLGRDAVSLITPSSQHYEFVVLKVTEEVWRWSADQMFLAVLSQLTILPGETRTFTAEWDQRDRAGRPVNPGDYLVVGILIGGEQVRLTPRQLRITIR